jgi:hypothetical protein
VQVQESIATQGENCKACYAKKLKYATLRFLLNTIGRTSKGVRVGLQYGFDSGETLDYVYENKARGFGPIDKLIDSAYLNSKGWSGIRTRGVNIKKAINWAINKSSSDPKIPVELMDIASGPGRYVLDVLAETDTAVYARLYDLDEKGLAFGKNRADSLGLKNVEFKKQDAFSKCADSNAARLADVAIVSGLYELFSNNEMVSRSLRLLNERVKDGAYLIYTNQPWHPQLEFIANVLINRNGEPWVMRCRAQSEMDALVKDAGFEKIKSFADEDGIFVVSIAVKRNLEKILDTNKRTAA